MDRIRLYLGEGFLYCRNRNLIKMLPVTFMLQVIVCVCVESYVPLLFYTYF